MPRPTSHARSARLAFPAMVALMLLLSVIPVRLLGWAGWTGGVAVAVISPIAHPVTELSKWLAPGSRNSRLADEQRQQLEDEIERYKLVALQRRLEIERLHDLVEQLAGARQFNPTESVRPIVAPVIGDGADPSMSTTLRVRVPSNSGVRPGTVVTSGSTQLLGRVDRVQAVYAEVRPITAASSVPLRGTILLDAEGARTLDCLLTARGDGTLRGHAEDPGDLDDADSPLQIGQRVCLKDPDWPASAQMLTIGTLVKIEPARDHPLRKVVTVQPDSNLRLVSEVVLRVPASSADRATASVPEDAP